MTHSIVKAAKASASRAASRNTVIDRGAYPMRKTLASVLAIALGVALPGAAWAGRNSSGTYSLPYGPVVTNTTINTTWANTTMSDLATAMTSSLDRSGHGGMLAPLACTDGSVGLPSFTFTNEPTTGLYRIGSNDVGFSIGGVKRWEHTAAGQIETGWLQIAGTVTASSVTSSGAKLSLAAPATFDLELSGSATVGFAVKADGTNDNRSRRLVNVADPTSAQDAVTKAFHASKANLPALGQQISTSCGTWSTVSTTPADVTNLSVTITTTGRPVMLMLQSDGGGNAAGVQSPPGSSVGLIVFRGATEIGRSAFSAGSGAVGSEIGSPLINLLDAVVAGTYTYKIQAYLGTATGTGYVSWSKLVAFEL